MVAAIVAIPVVETMARRIPVKTDRFARGRRIFNRICIVVIPIPAAASMTEESTPLSPAVKLRRSRYWL